METSTINNSSNNSNQKWIYIGIIALLVAALAYMYFSKNKLEDKQQITETELSEMSNEKAEIANEYNAALVRLDEMTGTNAQLDSMLQSKDGEVINLKAKIAEILKDKNASAEQLASAKTMIQKLNSKIADFERQIIELKKENIQLTEEKKDVIEQKDKITNEKNALEVEKSVLNEQKKNLETKVELGSVLKASNIKLAVINQKKNLLGKEKEVETSKSRKADLIRISFNLDDNRISESGEKEIYISIKNPKGSVWTSSNSGQINLKDGGSTSYTTKKAVPYKTGETTYGVSTDWKPADEFEAGTYTVNLYHMGLLIGSDKINLK